jgi:biopolymer transport protein ExbD
MSPLIDCVFQLLIFFMLSSSFLTPVIQLTLPQATTSDPTEVQEITVTVDEHGTFHVNTLPVPLDQLREHLRPLIAQSKHKAVTFRGDEKMRYEWFVKALDAARASGASHIHIAHQPESP